MSAIVAMIDDHSQKRRRIRSALEREALAVIEYDPATLKSADLDSHAQAIFVVDLVLPRFDGLEVIRHLRRTGHPAKIIAYSTAFP